MHCRGDNIINNAEQYLELFGELENRLRLRAGITENYVDFHTLVNTLVRDKKDRIVTQYERELKDYSALRNAIAHRYSKEPIADPRQDAINNLRDISNKLLNPQWARDVMTPKPMAFQLDDSLKDSLGSMSAFGYTSVPVYKDSMIVGILSEQSVLKWVGDSIQADGVLLTETKDLTSIRKYLTPLEGGGPEIYEFVKKISMFSQSKINLMKLPRKRRVLQRYLLRRMVKRPSI